MKKRIKDLQIGDLVDLEGDPYADPQRDNHWFQCEYLMVNDVDHETPDCTAIWFEGWDCCGFPPSHEVEVADV